MGGFVDPFIPSPAWPQDIVFAGASWAGGASPLAVSSAQAMEFHLWNGSSPAFMNGGGAKGLAGAAVFPAGDAVLQSPSKLLHEQMLQQQHCDDLDFVVDGAGTLGSMLGCAPQCPVSLTDSAPVLCSSNESSGSEHSGSGAGLPPFLMGEQPTAWPPAYASISSMAGDKTSQSFGFCSISGDDLLHEAAAACTPNGKNRFQQQLGAMPSPQLQLHDDAEFNTGKLLSFAPGQQVTTPSIDTLQMNQKEFSSGMHHLNLSSLVPGPPLAPFNPKQCTEDGSGKNGNGVAGNGAAPKPRVRARRGQATDPHSIAERLRREKISDRMKNLQELVPNSNKTDKASMLEEIIEYIKFLQLQTKVLSMSRLGATEAVAPLLTESQNESSGLLLSPRSRSAGEGGLAAARSDELAHQDSAALEQEVAQLMENNMTAAMQYLQSKGLCLMPIGLATAISTQKGTSSAAVQPEDRHGGGDKDDVKKAHHGLKHHHHGSAKGMKSKMT